MGAIQRLGVGLVGAGFLARTRARCWRRVHGLDVRLAGVSSRTAGTARAFAAEFDVERAFETAEELVASPDVDLVDLCVPNRAHRALAELAFAAGKPVLCTKPLAAYVGQDLEPGTDPAATPRARMLEVAVREAEAMGRRLPQGRAPPLLWRELDHGAGGSKGARARHQGPRPDPRPARVGVPLGLALGLRGRLGPHGRRGVAAARGPPGGGDALAEGDSKALRGTGGRCVRWP